MSEMEKLGTTVEDLGHEYDWNDQIEKDGDEYVVAPEGDYNFRVINFERQRHPGSDKLPPCNKAVLSIEVQTAAGPVHIRHNLFLHSRAEWRLSEFFVGIGQKKHGEPLKMDWTRVIGSGGRCKVGIRTYKDKQYNEIKRFYDLSENQAKSWKTGF